MTDLADTRGDRVVSLAASLISDGYGFDEAVRIAAVEFAASAADESALIHETTFRAVARVLAVESKRLQSLRTD